MPRRCARAWRDVCRGWRREGASTRKGVWYAADFKLSFARGRAHELDPRTPMVLSTAAVSALVDLAFDAKSRSFDVVVDAAR
jgi:hypothetical protein